MKSKIILTCSFIFSIIMNGYSQTHRAYVTNFNDSTISVIDLKKLEKVTDIVTGKNPHSVDVSPDGKWVAVSNEGRQYCVSIINTATNYSTQRNWKNGTLFELLLSLGLF